jgi:EF-hand domain-containing protein 1
MASNFPKLPGYVPTHDPTIVNHKKVSHIKLEEIRNAKNVTVPLHSLPRKIQKDLLPEKNDLSKSVSHMQYPAHIGADSQELFEPTFVKLDKQVSYLAMQPADTYFC